MKQLFLKPLCFSHATELFFLTPVSANIMELFSYIVQRLMCLTYTRGLIGFLNFAGLSRLRLPMAYRGNKRQCIAVKKLGLRSWSKCHTISVVDLILSFYI